MRFEEMLVAGETLESVAAKALPILQQWRTGANEVESLKRRYNLLPLTCSMPRCVKVAQACLRSPRSLMCVMKKPVLMEARTDLACEPLCTVRWQSLLLNV